MKNKSFIKMLLFSLLLLLTGCGSHNDKSASKEYKASLAGVESELAGSDSELASPESDLESVSSESEELLDAFLAGEISAFYHDSTDTFMIYDLPLDAEDYFSFSVGDRVDLDNDGENEQILDGPYGGRYIDARDGKVYVLAEGEGTAGVLFYTYFDHAIWIVHCDTTHAGRQVYWLDKYDGSGNIVDERKLSAEYWDSHDDRYDENSDFTYCDEKISMEEFEALQQEILDSAAVR